MLFAYRKLNLLIFSFLILFLFSCSPQNNQDSLKKLKTKIINNVSIDLDNLLINLEAADQRFIPKLVKNNDGTSFYTYLKKQGEGEVDLKELEKRILLGNDLYKNDRNKIIYLLKKTNELKINNELNKIENGALGLWIPSRDLIVIDFRVINMGSPIFLDILRHELIHVAQSCFSGSRKNFPKRIGLPLEFSKNINLNLSHNVYSQNPKEVMNIEREAFTYSKVNGAAIKLLNKFCK